MDRISFEIFEPNKEKFNLTPNWIVLGLWIITICFFWAFDSIIPPSSTLGIIWIVSIMLVSMYYLFISFVTYEPLDGLITGEIEFKDDRLIINDKVFELKELSAIDFSLNDYYGRNRFPYRSNFSPALSQGVDNFVTFKDNADQVHLIYFRIQGKHGAQNLQLFINASVKLKAMSYYRAIDLIDVENVTKP